MRITEVTGWCELVMLPHTHLLARQRAHVIFLYKIPGDSDLFRDNILSRRIQRLKRLRRHICKGRPNEWKEVDAAIVTARTPTKIVRATGKAFINDLCLNRPASGRYLNLLQKDVKMGRIWTQ